MSRRSIEIARLATTTPGKFLKIDVTFNEGGINYFSGGTTQKGYRLHVTPIEDKVDGGWSTMLGSGIAHTLETTARFNQKRLEAVAATVKDHPMYQKCIEHVLAKEGLTLAAKPAPKVTPQLPPPMPNMRALGMKFATCIQENNGNFFLVGSIPAACIVPEGQPRAGSSMVWSTLDEARAAVEAAGVERYQLPDCSWNKAA